ATTVTAFTTIVITAVTGEPQRPPVSQGLLLQNIHMERIVKPTFTLVLATLLSLSLLSGCAATSVALGKKDLEVQTKTSTSVFVDPVGRDKRSVYLDVRSGVMEFDRNAFSRVIREQFAASDKGYRVVDDP